MKNIIEFYNQYDEDNRLARHYIEFIVTTYFLDDLIHQNDKILDVAAGTGAYSIYYAEKGCVVEAIDIVPKHIEILSSKIKDYMELFAKVGNALDLHELEDNFFDVVLNMGVVYHVDPGEVVYGLKECLRVLKPGGKLAIAYVNKFENYHEDKFIEYFNCYSPKEMEEFLTLLDVEILLHTATDGPHYAEFEAFHSTNSPTLLQSHLWLEDNNPETDFFSIDNQFKHILLVVKKK
jgi:ubiquinone/menaquinone biosynthesis C-methylase UbiE